MLLIHSLLYSKHGLNESMVMMSCDYFRLIHVVCCVWFVSTPWILCGLFTWMSANSAALSLGCSCRFRQQRSPLASARLLWLTSLPEEASQESWTQPDVTLWYYTERKICRWMRCEYCREGAGRVAPLWIHILAEFIEFVIHLFFINFPLSLPLSP